VELRICADTGTLASDACPRSLDELFAAGTSPPSTSIKLQTVRVAGDGACLAATYTPPADVREVTFPIYPPEFRDWAARNGIPQAPTQYCPPPPLPPDRSLALLNPPTASGIITVSQVLLSGSARGSYALEVGQGSSPATWQQIGQGQAPVESGPLGIWNTDGLEPGEYTLRLRVTTPDGVTIDSTQVVRVVR
jgi:hypothetical protein